MLGRGCLEPGWERHLPSRAVCSVLSLLPLCSWVADGSSVWCEGERALDGVPPRQLCGCLSRLPHPPDVSVSREVCRGHSSTGAVLAAPFRTAGLGWTDPVARELERAGFGLPGAGCIFPPVPGLHFPTLHLDWISENDFAVGSSHGHLL